MVPEMIIGSSAVTVISTHIALHCLCYFNFFLLKFWCLYHKTILIILKTVKILFFYQFYFTVPLRPCTHVPQTSLLSPQTHPYVFVLWFVAIHCSQQLQICQTTLTFIIFLNYFFIIFFNNIVLVLPFINMHPPWVYTWLMKIRIENIGIFMLRYQQHIL